MNTCSNLNIGVEKCYMIKKKFLIVQKNDEMRKPKTNSKRKTGKRRHRKNKAKEKQSKIKRNLSK